MKPIFPNVAVIGLGLIGGSIALELKKKGLAKKIIGVSRSQENRREALRRKAVDRVFRQPGEFLREADLVVLATPVASIAGLLKKIRPYLKSEAWVTDVGSVKDGIVKEASRIKGLPFIGGHPIAGTEQSGMRAAQWSLFKGKRWILTPSRGVGGAALQNLARWVKALGAHVVILNPKEHDRIFAVFSHLPNVLAYSLANAVARFKGFRLDLATSSLKDMTRLAGSPAEMWRDICLANRTELVSVISRFERELQAFKEEIRRQNAPALMRRFERGRKFREKLCTP